MGPYILRKELGRGITARVFYGWDPSVNVPVALKVLDPELAKDSSALAMFNEEGRVGLAVDCQNIVKTLKMGEHDGYSYIAFEYVHGVPMNRLMERGPMPEDECLWILRQMLQAIRELKKKGITHQDIKPENILIEKTGNCKLSDLGFARMIGGKINWDGFSAGTAFYMSPEQSAPAPGVIIDHRSDIYALAAVVYHAVTGEPPFADADEEEVRRRHIQEPLVPPRIRIPSVSLYFSDILTKMMEKEPDSRYQSPEEILLQIRQLSLKAKAPVVNISQVS